MSAKVQQVDYFHVSVDDKPGVAARILNHLSEAGVNLIGFSGFPRGALKAQLDFITNDTAALRRAVKKLGLELGPRKRAFLIQGSDEPGAIAAIMSALAEQNINATSLQAIVSGDGSYGALLWVDEQYLRAAAKALATLNEEKDIVDIASEESFPASDPPAWN